MQHSPACNIDPPPSDLGREDEPPVGPPPVPSTVAGPPAPPPAVAGPQPPLPSLAPPVDDPLAREGSLVDHWLSECAPWLTSSVLHALALILLALLFVGGPWGEGMSPLSAEFGDDFGELDLDSFASLDDLELETEPAADAEELPEVALEPIAVELPPWTVPLPNAVDGAAAGPMTAVPGGLAGRGAANRRRLAMRGGGTGRSEDAVELGLAWLAAHQLPDGSWRFDIRRAPQCAGSCRHHGSITTTTGSTGLALLCFLGAGYTHQEGPYQEVVDNGLYYLMRQMVVTDDGGDLREGTMYAHAIATLALAEAYAMTSDENLRGVAQLAVDYIVFAQHQGGGWRYGPKEPGDTTVTGWQVIALKAALIAGLDVPSPIWNGVRKFLDSVQADNGAYYGYRGAGRRPTTTSIGLLCRMMLGWEREHPALQRGIAFLSRAGPSDHDMYFNYYTAQLMRHHGGKAWKRWNAPCRDYLVRTQAKKGHERGSWQFRDSFSSNAGRLYNTTMAIMTLEVYYRYLPLYGDEVVDLAP